MCENSENTLPHHEHPHTHPENKKGCGSGCVITAVISVALLSACLIIGGILLLFTSVFSSDSGTLTGKLGGFSSADGLVERFVEGGGFSSNKIALVEIKGMIIDAGGGSSMWQIADSALIVKQLTRAQNDPDVKAVILYLDTPGGGVTAADNIYKKVLDVRNSGKKVVSYMNTMAASGGYYVAVGSDFVMAHRLCITGSIGVIMQTYNYHSLLGKIGMHTETYKSGKMKDMLDGSRVRTEEEKVLAQKIVDKIYSEFADIVAKGRKNLPAEKIKTTEIGDGRIFLGSEALELGMVDANGFYEDAIVETLNLAGIPLEDYKIISYKRVMSFSEIFSQMSSAENKISLELSNIKSWD
nr:signal peptide peptidase SppA [Victivallales bacterium]